jgi:hypothetical protein
LIIVQLDRGDALPPQAGELGLRHNHGQQTASTIADLRRAQRALHWDTGLSRILAVEFCDVCGVYDRTTIRECARRDCAEHRICEERYR